MPRLGASGVSSSTLGNYLMVAGQALRTLVVARLLGASDFGVLNISNVSTNFTSYADLGVTTVGEQRASTHRGAGDVDAGTEWLARTAGARILPTAGLSLALFVLSGFASALGHERLAFILVFVAISSVLQALWFGVRGWLRVTGQFRWAMYAQVTQVVAWLTIVPWGAMTWGLAGALWAMAASYVPPVVMGFVRCPVKPFLRPNWSSFRELLPEGLRVWQLMVSAFLLINVDQFIVGARWGDAALGMFGIAMLAGNAVVALSDGAAAAAHPQTLEAFSRTRTLDPFMPSVTGIMEVVQLAFGFLVPATWVAMGVVTMYFLTDYGPALPLVVLVCVAASFVGMATASNAALLAVGAHRRVPRIILVVVALKACAAMALSLVTREVAWVGLISLVGAAGYAVFYLRLVGEHMGLGARPWRYVAGHLQGSTVLSLLGLPCAVIAHASGERAFLVAATTSFVVSGMVHVAQFRATRSRLPRPPRGNPAK